MKSAHGQPVEILRVKPEISQRTKSRRLMALQTARRGSRVQEPTGCLITCNVESKGSGVTSARIFRDKRTTIISETLKERVTRSSYLYTRKGVNYCFDNVFEAMARNLGIYNCTRIKSTKTIGPPRRETNPSIDRIHVYIE